MRTNFGRWFWTLVAVLALAVAASPTFAADEQPSENKQPSEDVVAKVNGTAITQADLDREMNRVQRQFLMMGKPISDDQLAEVKKEALENLVDMEVLYQQCEKEGIKVDQAAVDEQMSTLKKRFSSEDEFKNWLSKMNLSEAEVESQFRKEMAIQQFIDKQFVQKTTVPEEEVKEYYEKYIKDKIEQQLKQEKVHEEVNKYLGKLKEKAKIERFLEQAPQ